VPRDDRRCRAEPVAARAGGGVIGPGTGARVYLACGTTDMRKSITGLAILAQEHLRQNPASGAVLRSAAARVTGSSCCTGMGRVFASITRSCRRAGFLAQQRRRWRG
jgi:hypothetical protein